MIMLLITAGLVVVSLFSPNYGHLIAVAITLSGLLYYFPFVYFKLNFKIIGKLFLISLKININYSLTFHFFKRQI